MSTEAYAHYLVAYEGDFSTLQDFTLRHLAGVLFKLRAKDGGQYALVCCPDTHVERLKELVGGRIRDQDDGICTIHSAEPFDGEMADFLPNRPAEAPDSAPA